MTGGVVSLPAFAVGGGTTSATTAAAAASLMGAMTAAGPLTMPLTMIPRLGGGGYYPGGAMPSSAAPGGGIASGRGVTVQQCHARLIKAYGRVYCAYVNAAASRLELYRFFTDTISLQQQYELSSTEVDLR